MNPIRILSVSHGDEQSPQPPHKTRRLEVTVIRSYADAEKILSDPQRHFDVFMSGILHPQNITMSMEKGKREKCPRKCRMKSDYLVQALILSIEISLAARVPKIILLIDNHEDGHPLKKGLKGFFSPDVHAQDSVPIDIHTVCELEQVFGLI